MRKLASHLEGKSQYWITSARSDENRTAEEAIRNSLGRRRIWGIGQWAKAAVAMKPGDSICFYAARIGLVGHATIVSAPRRAPIPTPKDPERFEWAFDLDSIELYLDKPVVIDQALTERLHAFGGKDASRHWSWFVQWSNRVTEHDFHILTGQEAGG